MQRNKVDPVHARLWGKNAAQVMANADARSDRAHSQSMRSWDDAKRSPVNSDASKAAVARAQTSYDVGKRNRQIISRTMEKGGAATIERRMANLQNAGIAKSTGLPRPAANVLGAVARNPGKVGAAMAVAAGAAYMLAPSKARADDGKPASSAPTAKNPASTVSIAKDVIQGATSAVGFHLARDMVKDAKGLNGSFAQPETKFGRGVMKGAGRVGMVLTGLSVAANAYTAAYGIATRVAASKKEGSGKDRTEAYTDSKGRNYANGRAITRHPKFGNSGG